MYQQYLKLFVSLLTISLISGRLVAVEVGQDAYVTGDIVRIPVLRVGASQYSLDLQLIPDTSPVQLKMVAAEDITSSNPDISKASSFSNNTLIIPVLTAGTTSYRIELLLVSTQPSVVLQLSKADQIDNRTDKQKADDLFIKSISQSIVQSKCVRCHSQGGIAGGTALKFERTSDSSQGANAAIFEALLNSRADGKDYILGKVSGVRHGGGRQISVGSTDYKNLSEFLTLLLGSSTSVTSISHLQFFDQVALMPNVETLRRAAVLFSGRIPALEELDKVKDGDDIAIRSAVRSLMTGDQLHSRRFSDF